MSKFITSQSARQALERLAKDIEPMTLAELGNMLAGDSFESPEALSKYFKRPLPFTTKIKQTLIVNGLITEAGFWKAFSSSMSRQREPIVLGPAGPGVVDNTINHSNQ